MNQTLHFIIAEGIETLTGGYVYDAEIVSGLRTMGWTVDVHEVGGGFPNPQPEELGRLRATLATLPADSLCVIDGLVFGAAPVEIKDAATRRSLIALVHHPLANETGLSESDQTRHWRNELTALANANAVIVTSESTRRALTERSMTTPCHVVLPGTELGALGTLPKVPSHLLTVATVTPRKAQSVLLDALDRIRDRSWFWSCAGSLSRDPLYAASLRAAIREKKLEDRVSLTGEIARDELTKLFVDAHLFVFPSLYEGFGIAPMEAISHGIPVISTTGGALSEALPPAATHFVPPNSHEALADAIAAVMDSPDRYERLSRGARQTRQTLRTWRDAADDFEAILRAPLG
ncbi:MAG: glycosyltransferase family 4 protein [Pseudomonadota bacterium]